MTALGTPKECGGNINRSLKPLALIFSDDESGPCDQNFSDKPDKIVEVLIANDEDSSYEGQINGNPLVDGIQATSAVNIPVKDDPDMRAPKVEKLPDLSRSQSAPMLSLTSADAEKKRNLLAESISSNYADRSEELQKTFQGTTGERLICDYSCALQRDILVQGRLFITPNWLCFKSNLLVWYTAICVRFTDISSITKDKTARIIPNAISVVANGEKHFFTSFVFRDKVYDQLVHIWKISFEGQILSIDDIWQLVQQNYKTRLRANSNGDEIKEVELKEIDRSAHNPALLLDDPNCDGADSGPLNSPTNADNATFTDGLVCQDKTAESHSHNGKCMLNETYPVSLSQLCEMIFTDSPLFADYAESQTMKNVQIGQWNPCGQQNASKERTVKYDISARLPVGMRTSAITEKQKCQLLKVGDGQTVVHVVSECYNKGVPYADAFIVSNNYCISEVATGQARLAVYSEIIYTQNLWGMVKGFIEKNVNQGVATNYSVLDRCLQAACVKQPKLVARNEPMQVNEGEGEVQSANVIATVAAAEQKQEVSREISSTSSQSSQLYKIITSVLLLLLLLLISGQSIVIFKLLSIEPCIHASPPQYWQTQSSCGKYEGVPVAILEQQQKQHEQDMAALRSLLEKSLKLTEGNLTGQSHSAEQSHPSSISSNNNNNANDH